MNLVCAARLTQETEKRNEVIRMQQLETYLIEQYDTETPTEIVSESESEKSSSPSEKSTPTVDLINEPNLLLKEEKDTQTSKVLEIFPRTEKIPIDLISLPIQSKPSTESNLSPPVKKLKLEFGLRTNKTLQNPIEQPPTPRMLRKPTPNNPPLSPSRILRKPNAFTKTEIPKLNLKTLHVRLSNSHQIRAPPPSPNSTFISPRNTKGSEVNVASRRSGIFEARKRLLEKSKGDSSNSGSDRSTNSKKSVAIVDGKGNIKYVHKDKIGTSNK